VRAPRPVLFIDNSDTFGGAINSLGHLFRSLDESTILPKVVSAQPRSTLADIFPPGTWHHLPISHRGERKDPLPPNLPRWQGTVRRKIVSLGAFLTQDLAPAFKYAELAKAIGAAAIHLNNGVTQLDGILAARILGVPCVAHSRGFIHPSDGVGMRLARHWVQRHVAISSAIRQNLIDLGICPATIILVPDGIELDAFRPDPPSSALREDLGIPAGAPVIGFSGRIVQWKGVREFLKASFLVLAEFREARVLLIGDPSDGGPEYYSEVLELARSSGFSERIIFAGYRADIPELMRLVDVLVHTSIEPEPFGMVLIEAMATGTPVVAARAGGPLDIVLDGVTGFLANPEDPNEVASRVLALLRDSSQRTQMGEAASRRVRECYSAELAALRITELYRAVFKEHRLSGFRSGGVRP